MKATTLLDILIGFSIGVLAMSLVGTARAAASEQGCASSGNTAAGCASNATGGNATGGNATNTSTLNATLNGGNNTVTGGAANASANGGSSRADSTNVNTNGNSNNNSAKQGQKQGQAQGQSQRASANSEGSTAGSNSGGNSMTVNQNDATQKLQAPGLGVGYAAPSAVCALTSGVALSVPGGAGSIGTSSIDKGCERREWVRVLKDLGAPEAAARVACSDPVVAEANPVDCDQIKQSRPAAAASTKTVKPAAVGGRS